MDNDPFAGSSSNEIHIDALKLKKLVTEDPRAVRFSLSLCNQEP
jgi:hypothetical protein